MCENWELQNEHCVKIDIFKMWIFASVWLCPALSRRPALAFFKVILIEKSIQGQKSLTNCMFFCLAFLKSCKSRFETWLNSFYFIYFCNAWVINLSVKHVSFLSWDLHAVRLLTFLDDKVLTERTGLGFRHFGTHLFTKF